MTDYTKINNIVTHNGMFHADDVMCVALIKHINNGPIEVERTRDLSKIKEYEKQDNTIVCDVGLGFFDHHQDNVKLRKDGRKYAACGLLYEFLVDNNILPYDKEFLSTIKKIEHFDNGETLENEKEHVISALCRSLNSLNNTSERKDIQDEGFIKAVELTTKFIETHFPIPNKKQRKDILELIDYVTKEKEEENNKNKEEIFNELIKELSHSKNKEILILKTYIPKILFCDTPVKFIIYEDLDNKQMVLSSVPVSKKNKFLSKKEISIEFKDNFTFLHNQRFMGTIEYKTANEKEIAIKKLKDIAEKCLMK